MIFKDRGRKQGDLMLFFFLGLMQESSIAVVLPQKPEKQEETLEQTPTDIKVEVIKVGGLVSQVPAELFG